MMPPFEWRGFLGEGRRGIDQGATIVVLWGLEAGRLHALGARAAAVLEPSDLDVLLGPAGLPVPAPGAG